MNLLNDPTVNRGVVWLIASVAGCISLSLGGLTLTQFVKWFGRWGDRNRRFALEKAQNKTIIEMEQFAYFNQKYGQPGIIQPLNTTKVD